MRRLLAAACGLVLLAGCGNVVGDIAPAGLLGMTVDDDGHRVAVGYVCHGSVDRLSIVQDRTGLSDSEDNPEVATYTAATPRMGLVRLDLDSPSGGWTRDREPDLQDGAGYLLTMEGSGDDDSETSTVWITGQQLAGLEADQVVVNDGNVDEPTLESTTVDELEADAKKICAS